jgi:hypothetical protein
MVFFYEILCVAMNKKSYILLVFAFFVGIFACKFYCTQSAFDFSKSPPLRTNKNFKVHLVSYADGDDIQFMNQNAQAQMAVNKGIDVIWLLNRNHLDHNFVQKNKKILEQKRGVGFWLWKPYVILKTLEKAEEGDLVIYLDSGSLFKTKTKTPFLLWNILNAFHINNSKFLLAVKNTHANAPHTKRDVYEAFKMDGEKYWHDTQLDASFVVFKKNKQAIAFVQEWLKYCENEALLTDSPSQKENLPEFLEHRHDQSILTLLSYKYNTGVELLSPEDKNNIIYHHRRRVANKPRSLLGK